MRASDLQDIFLNEPWFLAEGVVCGALVWSALRGRAARTWWLAGATFATGVCTVFGLLSAAGVVGRSIVF